MCFNIRKNYKHPRNGVLRYKVVRKTKTRFESLFWCDVTPDKKISRKIYNVGKASHAYEGEPENSQSGFHMFTAKKDAIKYAADLNNNNVVRGPFVVIKCKCHEFLHGGKITPGYWGGHTTCETWRTIIPVEWTPVPIRNTACENAILRH